MEERDRIRYETLFYCQKLEDGFLSGDTARALFIRSKLPLIDLTRIWKLSDLTRDNKLDVFEFSLAMHFIELKLMGGEIPKQHDIKNVGNNKEVVIPKLTLEEKQKIDDIFEHADTNSQAFLEMNVVKPMLLISGLSPSTLSRIWYIADLDRSGRLCLLEFSIAIHLVKNCVKGLNLNGPVNPFACFPDEEDAVCLIKEKLAIFDKEFLLKQIQEDNNEDEVFLNSTDSAESSPGFQLLTAYFFDGQFVSSQGKRYPESVDENLNVFHTKDEKVLLFHDNKQRNKTLVNSADCDSVLEAAPAADCTETIERREIDKNVLNVDLDDIFETVSKANMDEYEETPKFTAKLAGDHTATEVDEEESPPVLALYQKRAYLGKDLVFEDPIGSDVIGDVQFEVDFEYIINDIEREMVDEERRLPIARVLPIYKSSPPLEEQPFGRTVSTKDSQEIDLNFIDAKTDGFSEKKNGGLTNRKEKILINAVTKESNISEEGIIINEHNMFKNCHVQSTENFDNVCGAVDIVEQKRLLTQSQQEERKRLRENQIRNKECNEKPSGFFSSVAVVGNAKQFGFDKSTDDTSQERHTEVRSNLNYNNNYLGKQRKGNQSIFEGDDIISNTPDSTGPASKSCVTSIMQSSEDDMFVNSDYESKHEDEEEKERLRKAEDKEKRLLERIKFLEKKRQLLYEKNQRKLNMNNDTPRQDNLANLDNRVNETRDQENARKFIETHRVCQEQNSKKSASRETWGFEQHRGEINEDEKRRLAEALAAKKKSEAELERQRQEVLREAEKRRLEEDAKIREEQEAAKERKRHFLENLQKLKERVRTEEEEKSKVPKSQSKDGTSRSVHSTGRSTASLCHFNKCPESLPGYTKNSNTSEETGSSNAIQKNMLAPNQTNKLRSEADERKPVRDDNVNLETEEEQKKAEEMRLENFKSNRELFMKKIQTVEEQSAQEQKRENRKKIRPKSFYGGMFNKPVHQIIDDSLLAQNVDSVSAEDLVDKEALKQFEREQELKKEHEKIDKLRHSLERESSYTVENVEKLFGETDTESKTTKQACNEWDNLEWKEAQTSSHPRRRSLVNTLTSEWNSFIDILEEDNRRESDAVKIRKELSAQRKASPVTKPVNPHVDVVKNDSSKDKTEEKEMFAKQAGKVKKLVTSYKRLSMPCFLDHDDKWNVENSEEETKTFETRVQTERSSTLFGQEPDDKKIDQKTVIKQNAPKRKTDLAHAWTHMVSNHQNAD